MNVTNNLDGKIKPLHYHENCIELIKYDYSDNGGLLWRLSNQKSACQCKRLRFNPWVRKIPWRRKWQPAPVFLSGKSCGQRSLKGHKESAYHCRRCRRLRFNPWVRKIPRRRARQPTPVFLPGEFHGQRSLVGHSLWGCRVGRDLATERQ